MAPHRMAPHGLLVSAALLGLALAAACLPAQADPFQMGSAETAARQALVPVEAPAPAVADPDLLDRAGAVLDRAWDRVVALADAAGRELAPLWGEARERADGAAALLERTAAPVLDEAGAQATLAWLEAERLTADARDAAGELAGAFHAKTAELREHPVVQAAADVGILLRVAEALGVSVLVGGLAWRKLRGA